MNGQPKYTKCGLYTIVENPAPEPRWLAWLRGNTGRIAAGALILAICLLGFKEYKEHKLLKENSNNKELISNERI